VSNEDKTHGQKPLFEAVPVFLVALLKTFRIEQSGLSDNHFSRNFHKIPICICVGVFDFRHSMGHLSSAWKLRNQHLRSNINGMISLCPFAFNIPISNLKL
jgi:hypothetical protein